MILVSFFLAISYMALQFRFFKNNLNLSVPYAYFVFFQLWAVCSVVYLDVGFFSSELNQYTFYTGASACLALILIAFHYSYAIPSLFLQNFRVPLKKIAFEWRTVSIQLALFLFLSIFCLYDVFSKTNGVVWDRAAYSKNLSTIEIFTLAYAEIIFYFLGMVFACSRHKKTSLIVALIFFMYFFASGNKFSLFFSVVAAFSVPFLFVHRIRFHIILIFFISLVLIFVTLAFYKYYMSEGTFLGAFYILMDRVFSGQGQVFWAGYNFYFLDSNSSISFMFEDFSRDGFFGSVLLRIMADIVGYDNAMLFFERGYLFTMGSPVFLVSYFGFYWTVLIFSLFGLILSFLSWLLYMLIMERQLYLSVICFSFLWPFVNFTLSGEVLSVFKYGMLLKAVLLLGGVLVLYNRKPVVSCG